MQFGDSFTDDLESMHSSQCINFSKRISPIFLDKARGDTYQVADVRVDLIVLNEIEEFCLIRDCAPRQDEIVMPKNNNFVTRYEQSGVKTEVYTLYPYWLTE